MNIFHTETAKKWNEYTICEQMANIGAEVGRSFGWRNKNAEMSKHAVYRALELIDFSIDDPKNKDRLAEILRVRETLVDYCCGDNIYQSSDKQWNDYFFYFNQAARSNQ